MKRLLSAVASCLLLTGCYCKSKIITAHFIRGIDGDTFIADIDYGYPKVITRNIPIRIARIDTPELNDPRPEIRKLALEARDFTNAKLSNANVIELRNLKRGKYFRILSDVYIDNKNLGEMLLDKALAVPYGSARKLPQ